MNQANEFTEVFRAANLSQGGTIREMLLNNGIDCYMNPSVPTLPWDGDVRVLCGVSDAARARELIGAYLQSELEANEDEEGEDDLGEDEDLDDEEDEDFDDEEEEEEEEEEEDEEEEEEEDDIER